MDKDLEKTTERNYASLRFPIALVVLGMWSVFLIEGRRYVEGFSPLLLTVAGIIFVTLLSRMRSSAFKDSPQILPFVMLVAWLIEELLVGKARVLLPLLLMLAGGLIFSCLVGTVLELSMEGGVPVRGGDAHLALVILLIGFCLGMLALPANLKVLRLAFLDAQSPLRHIVSGLTLFSLGMSFLVVRKQAHLRVASAFGAISLLVFQTALLIVFFAADL